MLGKGLSQPVPLDTVQFHSFIAFVLEKTCDRVPPPRPLSPLFSTVARVPRVDLPRPSIIFYSGHVSRPIPNFPIYFKQSICIIC